MRVAMTAAIVCLSVLGICTAEEVSASIRKPINIPPQPLDSALETLAKDRGIQLIYRADVIGNRRTEGAVGQFTPEEALRALLAHTGLTYQYLTDSTVTIIPQSSGSAPPAAQEGADTKESSPEQGGQKQSFWDRFHLAQVGPGQAAGGYAVDDAATEPPAAKGPPRLEEIVVTAQKRAERLQDIPIPVTAISADQLVESNQLRLQDYFSTVPGLNVAPMGLHSVQTLSMRGITTGSFGNSPVAGVTLDDVPLGSSTSVGGGVVAPDLDPSDLARIEVLRGPQGTLYGASSLGGLLKFVTLDPSTADGLKGQVQAGSESIHDSGGLGYSFRGAVSGPVLDTLAVRVSGFTREDPGYIDNPLYALEGVNGTRARGGLVSALWHPLDVFSLKLNALYQDRKADGSSDVDLDTNGYAGPPTQDLQQTYLPGIGGSDKKLEAYSATAGLRLGNAELTSVSGYNVMSYFDSFDFSYAVGGVAGLLFPGADGAPLYEHGITNKFSQELRLSMPLGSRIDWLLGGFYTHESSHYHESILATRIATAEDLGTLYLNSDQASLFEEYAAFTDITFHITDQFNVQLGGRESHIKQSTAEYITTGPFAGPTGVATNEPTSTTYSPFTYLITPQFKFSTDLMVYARLASGYRAGGGGSQGPTATCMLNQFPCSYGPDKTYNYELGIKGSGLDGLISFDASLFYIKWKDIQVAAVKAGANGQSLYGYISNGGEARSRGAELSMDVRPLEQLTLSARLALTDAVLTQNFPGFPTGSVYGASGEKLPDSSRFTGYLAAERIFRLSGSLTGVLGADLRYVSSHMGQFNPTPDRQYFSPYAQTDIHAGLTYDAWSATVFGNNITDKRGALAGGLGSYPPYAFTYIQPRTVGVTLSRSF